MPDIQLVLPLDLPAVAPAPDLPLSEEVMVSDPCTYLGGNQWVCAMRKFATGLVEDCANHPR